MLLLVYCSIVQHMQIVAKNCYVLLCYVMLVRASTRHALRLLYILYILILAITIVKVVLRDIDLLCKVNFFKCYCLGDGER